MNVLLAANTIAAVATIAFAVLRGDRPAALSDSASPTGGERFYGWMYAARGVPLGVAGGVAPLSWPGPACALILFAAAAAQAVAANAELFRQYQGFAEPVELAPGAPEFDRLLASTGRDPAWTAS